LFNKNIKKLNSLFKNYSVNLQKDISMSTLTTVKN